ncbi:MAG: amino acid ABC transporter permease [Clostridia bacterium]|nr:amino acid ABC transporter permease [Clostridia bacterium]
MEIFPKYLDYFVNGTKATILLSLFVVLIGSVLGSFIALLRLSKFPLFSGFAKAYISVLRGTPLLVQLYIVYFQFSFLDYPDIILFGMDMERTTPCIIALSLNSAAYVAEIVRAGIQAVDKGQGEAARSIGMTQGMAMRTIILPQAIKNILPAIGNEFVTMIKETAVVQYLGVADLMYNNGIVTTATYNPLPCYYISAAIYFILNYVMSSGVNIFERRLRSSD